MKLKFHLIVANMTQAELADLVGVDRSRVTWWCKLNYVPAKHARHVAQLLRAPLEDLLPPPPSASCQRDLPPARSKRQAA